jgi:capsular exopolysaccharide synthesis family protein
MTMSQNALTVRDYDSHYASIDESQTSRELASVFWYTVGRWWLVAIPLGLLLALAAASAVYFTFQPQYTASIWLRIHSRAPYIVFQSEQDSYQFVQNQTQLIRSRLVLSELLSDPAIANLPELQNVADKGVELANRIHVNVVGQSEFFSIEYEGPSKETSKQVVSRVISSYLALQDDQGATQQQEVIDLLETEKAIRERKVLELRKELAKLVESSTPNELQPSEEELSTLSELRKRAVVLDVESAILQIEIQAYKNANEGKTTPPPVEYVERAVQQHQGVIAMENDIARLEDEMRLYSGVGVNHPSVRAIRNELTSRRARLQTLREKVQRNHVATVKEKENVHWKNELNVMKSRLASFEITKNVIAEHLEQETQSVRKSTGEQLRAEFLRAELQQATEVHDLISKRLVSIQTEQRAPSRVQLVDSDGIVAVPMELIPQKKMALASAGAFTIPLALFFLMELLLRRVNSVRQLEENPQFKVIGEISSLPRPKRLPFVGRRKFLIESNLYRESVDHLRTCVALQKSMNGVQTIAVNSAVSREGKTSLIVHLAESLNSVTNKRVLIVDGDMRHPNAHDLLGQPLAPGLAEVLTGKVQWEAAVCQPKPGGPYLLSAGKLNANPHAMLGNKTFERLLAQFKKKFRYIVIDTPPVLAASESIVMACAADAFLMCTMQDRSRMKHVHLAHEHLLMAGARPLGTVLNGVPFRSYIYRYSLYPYAKGQRDWINTPGVQTRLGHRDSVSHSSAVAPEVSANGR